MTSPPRIFLTCLLLGLLVAGAHAQPPAPGDAKDAPPPGVDKFYYDLTKSQDRGIKAMAERYLNLVKLQEWSDKSGQFKTLARYVKHDANLTTVTIEVAKGRGAERTTEEKTVPVDKLSVQCQSRVRQIDAAQKKLQELAAAKPGENGAAPAGPAGAPMRDDRGEGLRGRPGPPPGSGPPGAPPPPPPAPGPPAPAADAGPDPSASDPDPLGFAELSPAPAGPPAGLPPGGPPTSLGPPPGPPSNP